MATLMFSQIRGNSAQNTLEYIANQDKVISEKNHDVYTVLNYMGAPESVDRVYSLAQHCSSDASLAARQMELYRDLYYASKNGAVPKKGELIGLHFFLSYTEEDNPGKEVMNDIVSSMFKHPLLEDFACFSANHFDKDHKHSHFYVCQFSAVGKPRKMGLKFEDLHELRRFVNRLCVEHGLSIIDEQELRKDPEYTLWIDSVILDGKIQVHPESTKKNRGRKKQKVPSQSNYYRWMRETAEQDEKERRMLTEEQRFKRDFKAKYFYAPDGDDSKLWYVSGDSRGRFYAVPIRTREGRNRSLLEQMGYFVMTVAEVEGRFIQKHNPRIYKEFEVKVDWKLQGMYDALCTAREMNVNKPSDVPLRMADVGKRMNDLRIEKSRHEASIAKHEEIMDAYQAYMRTRLLVEGVQEPLPAAESTYMESYAILAQNRILTAEAYERLCRRYAFEKQKIIDYESRIPKLKKQYRDLKKLETVACRPVIVVNNIFAFSDRAVNEKTIDDVIASANNRMQDINSDTSKNIERVF